MSADEGGTHGEDEDDRAARRGAHLARDIKRAVIRFTALAGAHGAGTVALANMGRRGVRIVFVAGDGTYGDAIVPSPAAAEQVCAEGGWDISGWDVATSKRIQPSDLDRRRMAGTGR